MSGRLPVKRGIHCDVPRPLNPEAAQALDKQIRREARAVDQSWGILEKLIAGAKAGKIHAALGFTSWPAYIADVARREMPNIARSVEQRRQVVALLSGEGMSQRSIADAVGVSQKTVDRDPDQVSHDDSPDAAVPVTEHRPPVESPDRTPGQPPDRSYRGVPQDGDRVSMRWADGTAWILGRDAAAATITGLDGKTYTKPKPKQDRFPAPTTFGRLTRKLRDMRRMVEECAFMIYELEEELEDEERSDIVNDLVYELQSATEDLVESRDL
jgi:hypothetical protein